MDNQDIDIKKIKSLINSHLYDLEGIKKSKTLMQEVCTFYKDNFGDGDDYHQVRTLVYEYIEIVDYFLKMHTEFSNEEIDNCIDALNSIRYKILRIGKQNSVDSLTRLQKIKRKCKWCIYCLMCKKDHIIKSATKNILVRKLRGKLINAISPVTSHRTLNQNIY
mgnify:CR=1 FL=1